MKLLLTTLIISVHSLSIGQSSSSKKDIKLRNEIWADSTGFHTIQIPEKWNAESAIILNKKRTFVYSNTQMYYSKSEEIIRKRIKLLDKASIEYFSEFYFYKIKSGILISTIYKSVEPYMAAGFKIIKPNGKEIIVDLEGEAVDFGEIPNQYNVFRLSSEAHTKKVAIPNLEIGDVIDFFYYTKTPYFKGDGALYGKVDYQFPSHYISLLDEYPICSQYVEVKLQKSVKGLYLNSMSLNGGNSLTLINNQKQGSTRNKKYNRFTFLDNSNREKSEFKYFRSKTHTEPLVKFQVYHVTDKSRDKTSSFIGKNPHQIKSNTALGSEVSKRISNRSNYDINIVANAYANNVLKKINKKQHTLSKDEKIKLAYYQLRYDFLFNEDKLGSTLLKLSLNEKINKAIPEKINPMLFYEIMSRIFKGLNITNDIGITVPRSNGGIEFLLMDSEAEVTPMVYLDSVNSHLYLFPFTLYSEYNYISPDYLGTKTISFIKNETWHKKDSLSIGLPEDNTQLSEYIINDLKLGEVNSVIRTTSNSGTFKVIESEDRLYHEDFRYLQMKKYDPKQFEKLKEIELNTLTDNKEIIKKERLVLYKEKLIDEGKDIHKYNEFNIVEIGMDQPEKEFIYKEKFDLNGLVTKAGNDYFINVGLLIGSQLKIDEKHKSKRDIDIYVNFPKSLVNTIKIKIPEGYTAENLEALNTSIENNTGLFTSMATFENNILMIKTVKNYKAIHLPKEEWNNLVKMLEVAYECSQQKVILKKL